MLCPRRVQTSGSLLITSPSPRDEGWFECIATNAAGEARKVFLVSVHGEPGGAASTAGSCLTGVSPPFRHNVAVLQPPPELESLLGDWELRQQKYLHPCAPGPAPLQHGPCTLLTSLPSPSSAPHHCR